MCGVLSLLSSVTQDLRAQPEVGQPRFELRVPAGTGRFPVVALVPGCSGFRNDRFRSRFDWYVEKLIERGFATVRIDYLGSRGVREPCADANTGIWEPRISADLEHAAKALATDARLDATRLFVVGWSLGGGGVLAYLSRLPHGGAAAFCRAVVYYPTCRSVRHLNGRIPTLLFLPELDNIQPVSFCDSLMSALDDKKLVSVRRFESSHHAFDLVELPVMTVAAAQATVAANPAAAKIAWDELLAFFDKP